MTKREKNIGLAMACNPHVFQLILKLGAPERIEKFFENTIERLRQLGSEEHARYEELMDMPFDLGAIESELTRLYRASLLTRVAGIAS